MAPDATVYVVDDDAAVRESIATLLQSQGIRTEIFPEAQAFLQAFSPERPGCLIVDVRLPGISGLDLQRQLAEMDAPLPVIVITGHADVPMAARAMRAGALDFIEKPFPPRRLLEVVGEALALDARRRLRQQEETSLRAGLARLTASERTVLHRVAEGTYNKVTAAELGVSVSTVEAYRRRLMRKLGAESLYDLVRAAELDAGTEE